MPTYEHRCTKCKKLCEEIRPMSRADDSMKCPSCGKKATRIVGSTSFRLAGCGWYETMEKSCINRKNVVTDDD